MTFSRLPAAISLSGPSPAVAVALARLLLLQALLTLCGTVAASDTIFLCVDADGHKTYQNSDGGSACRRLDGLEVSVPSPGNHSASAQPTNARSLYARPAVALPASFPRVEPGTQRARDNDRRTILEDELRSEQQRLQQLQQQYQGGHPPASADESAVSPGYRARVQTLAEDIERSEGNIASLRRELGGSRN